MAAENGCRQNLPHQLFANAFPARKKQRMGKAPLSKERLQFPYFICMACQGRPANFQIPSPLHIKIYQHPPDGIMTGHD